MKTATDEQIDELKRIAELLSELLARREAMDKSAEDLSKLAIAFNNDGEFVIRDSLRVVRNRLMLLPELPPELPKEAK